MSIATPELRIDDRVKGFIASPRKLLIDGQWVEAASGKIFPTFNPATGEVLAQVAEGEKADIDRAVQAARAAFDNGAWRRITTSERGKLIWKLADLLETDGQRNSKATPFQSRYLLLQARNTMPTPYVNPLVSWGRLYPGIFHFSWLPGN
jgi:hypothetical protein